MSNPAVIILAEVCKGLPNLKKLQIEDNIGEAIHLHFGPVRLDFTVTEFMAIAGAMKEALNSTNQFKPYLIEQFDPLFIMNCAPLLTHLQRIEIKNFFIDDMRCIVHRSLRFGAYSITTVKKTPAYRFLSTGNQKFLSYDQKHYFHTTNKDRLLNVATKLEKFGYPYDGKYIILFEGQNIVRDGQHRLAALRYQLGNVKIPMMVFHFSKRVKLPLIQWRPYARVAIRFGHMVARYMQSQLIFKK